MSEAGVAGVALRTRGPGGPHLLAGRGRPRSVRGYGHELAGMVWGGKIDFATWFDPRPSAVIGIQLLPVNLGSIYRADPEAAVRRYDAAADDLLWPDVAVMDLALGDPARAGELLSSVEDADDGNTLAFTRWFVDALTALGPPRDDVVVDSPFGAAFGRGDDVTLVGVNPTDASVEIGFRRDGTEIGRLTLAPGQSVTRPA